MVDPAWVEINLKRFIKERNIMRVTGIELESAVTPGNNYASEMIRVRLHVILGSGRKTRRSVMLKRLTEAQDVLQAEGTFPREIQVYTKILPELETLMKNHEDVTGKLWCDFLGHTGNTEILMEDLKESGFTISDRRYGHDLEHSLLVVSGIARLHALSKIAYEELHLDFSHLDLWKICTSKFVHDIFRVSLHKLKEVVRTSWEQEWFPIVQKLEKLMEEFPEKIGKLIEFNEKNFNVFCHGDTWSSNIMFRYNPYLNKPIEIRFLDFQVSHYNSFAWDLIYYFKTSIKPEVLEKEYDTLIQTYRHTLVTTFNMYDFQKVKVSTEDEIKQELKRIELVGLLFSLCFRPLIICPQEEIMDITKMKNTDPNTCDAFTDSPFREDTFTKFARKELSSHKDLL